MRHLSPGLVTLVLLHGMAAAGQTVESTHKGLSSGPLRHARLASLSDGTVVRAGALRVTNAQLAAEISKAAAKLQPQLRRNAFLLAEQRVTRLLLAAEATDWAARTKRVAAAADDAARTGAYLQDIAGKAVVSDAEAREFYESNRDTVGGAAYDAVASDLKQYLLQQKRQAVLDEHINGLSNRKPIEVDAAWCKVQAETALDNPVDRARRSGKPALVDFGSKGCRPCDMLAPILDELRKAYAGKCAVLFVQVTENQMLAARYGVSSIPVQIFFDKDGSEVSRHVGFIPKDLIIKQLAGIGVK